MVEKAPLPALLNKREREILAQLSTGLSDQEIADQLFLSLHTIKWYNRQIYSKLGVRNRTEAIAQAKPLGLLDQTSPQSPPPPAIRHNLPAQPTSFIGRSREIDEVASLLVVNRLVTLTGTGGTGKTRLALQIAEAVAGNYPGGIHFVNLAPLSDYTLVSKAIATTLGVFEKPSESLLETVKRALAQQEVLLVMDNFEHLIPAVPLISELMATSRKLRVLATSREALRLAGEQEYPVVPLSLPSEDSTSVQELTDSESGALFIQRAQMILPYFMPGPDNAAAIAQICIRLDGLPLAIELAAAQSKLLTPQELLKRLEGTGGTSPLRTLARGARDASPRHRTLEDAINWSYNLLNEDERKLFIRLAIFHGSRSLEAIEAVCQQDLSTDGLECLASLVDKSLVQQQETPGGELRFVMLEMIQEFARQRLEASGEIETMHQRHAEYFVALAEKAEPEFRLDRHGYWCRRFELELDNLRAVLDWALDSGDVSLGVRLAGASGLFWYSQGYHTESLHWTQRLLERLDEVPRNYHADFLISAGRMAWMVDLNEARGLFERALQVSRELGDDLQAAWALAFLGFSLNNEPGKAMPFAKASLAMFHQMDHLPGIAQALNIIGELARISGNYADAKLAYAECLAVCHQTGETLRICYTLNNLAFVAQHEGDHEHALMLLRQALQMTRDTQDARDIASVNALVTFAGSIAALGQPDRAAKLLGAAESARERMGGFYQPADKPEIDRILASVHAQLDNALFQAAWTEGLKMSLDQAVSNALVEH